MNRIVVYSSIILGTSIAVSIVARLFFPQIQPILEGLRILFYLILAVTVIAILRNVFGLITYGVFGPAIISLGLTVIGDISIGIIVLFTIIGVGLVARALLEPLELQMTHRMAITVITVSATMGVLKYVGFAFGNDPLTLASFLPILISAWTVERLMRDRQESGLKTSVTRFTFTLVAVLASFLLISEKSIIDYFIYTPELWVLPVAINLLIGSVVRVRFSEYFRFRRLFKSDINGGGGYSKVLTVNVRNKDFINQYNSPKFYPKITKLDVKESLQKVGIPVPRTLAVFDSYRDMENLRNVLESLPAEEGFVIKPNNSFGGRGITVIKRRNGEVFGKVNGELITVQEIKRQLETTVDGDYSGRWMPDKAFVEELVVSDPILGKLAHSGLPDVRVIVFRGIPIMAMARLPTKMSNGKANLHQGAIGAGINLMTGRISNAVVAYEKTPITNHPDTGARIVGEQIPFWEKLLHMAIASEKATGLGYAGIDIVIDRDKGPLVMEVNKRPGMEIQNANNEPLLGRLRSAEYFLTSKKITSTEEGIEAMHFLESRSWKFQKDKKTSSMEDLL